MFGAISDVDTRAKHEVRAAVQIPSSTHNLQLCFQDVSAASVPIRGALNFSTEVHHLMRISPKRLDLHVFENKHRCSNHSGANINTMWATRWNVGRFSFTELCSKALQNKMNITVKNTPISVDITKRTLRFKRIFNFIF